MRRVASRKATGTSLQGYVKVSYSKLVRTLGKPLKGDGYKVDAEWVLQASDGTIATIYNYKTGKNYLGEAGKPVSKITKWHIGGNSPKALTHIVSALGGVPFKRA